jgi:hypothetical protein
MAKLGVKKIRFRGTLYNVSIYARRKKKGLVANLTKKTKAGIRLERKRAKK